MYHRPLEVTKMYITRKIYILREKFKSYLVNVNKLAQYLSYSRQTQKRAQQVNSVGLSINVLRLDKKGQLIIRLGEGRI